MGLKKGRQVLIDTIFAGRKDPLRDILVQTDSATTPSANVAAPRGTFLIMDYNGNAVDNDVWICTIGSTTAASTTWVQIYDSSTSGKIY